MRTLDQTDIRILRAMQSDGNLTVTEIAERAGLSQSPCSRRIISLQEEGVILGKATMLDPGKLGFNTRVIVRIKLAAHDPVNLEGFKRAVRDIPEIQTAQLVLGDFDFYLQVVVRDIAHYQQLLQTRLVALPGVREMQSSVIVEVVKNSTVLPL